ncbi:Transition state regulatory protein AbrB (plasmid) [Peribacillus frigoritolerans]
MVRKIDDLGRIVIPKELRSTLNINVKDPIEIFVERDKIILRKYESARACQITGEITEDNFLFADGKIVLSREGVDKLIQELKSLASF